MAFQKYSKQGAGNKPNLSVQLSVKQGKGYIKGPSFGFWTNENGGPAFRGTLKDDKLAEVLEFIGNAQEAGLPVIMAMFDNSEQAPASGGFKKASPNAFKKSGASFGAKKPNPFKQQEEQGDEPNFGE